MTVGIGISLLSLSILCRQLLHPHHSHSSNSSPHKVIRALHQLQSNLFLRGQCNTSSSNRSSILSQGHLGSSRGKLAHSRRHSRRPKPVASNFQLPGEVLLASSLAVHGTGPMALQGKDG